MSDKVTSPRVRRSYLINLELYRKALLLIKGGEYGSLTELINDALRKLFEKYEDKFPELEKRFGKEVDEFVANLKNVEGGVGVE